MAIIRKNAAAVGILISLALNGNMSRYKDRITKTFNYFTAIIISIILLSIYLTAVGTQLSIATTSAFIGTVTLIIGIIFYRNFSKINTKLEYTFIANFNKHLENDEEFKREKLRDSILTKYPWPIDVCEITIGRWSIAAGKAINELAVRKQTGANIVAIEREGFVRYDITPLSVFYPGDMVIVIGSGEQIKKTQDLFARQSTVNEEELSANSFQIEYLVVGINPDFLNKSLRELSLTRKFGVSIVGIQRGGERITSPGADEIIKSDDILLVMGKPDDVEDLRKEIEKL